MENERFFETKFIWIVRYVDWVSNIVPFIKKNGSLRLCIYFRDLNVFTPKNKYIMSNRLNIWWLNFKHNGWILRIYQIVIVEEGVNVSFRPQGWNDHDQILNTKQLWVVRSGGGSQWHHHVDDVTHLVSFVHKNVLALWDLWWACNRMTHD